MARFRGTLESERGKIDTRLGHGHIHVEAQSYSGKVTTHLYVQGDEDWVRIEFEKHEGNGTNMILYNGPVNPGEDMKLVISNRRPEVSKNTYEYGLDTHKFEIEPAPWEGGE